MMKDKITIAARPHPLMVELGKTAILVIDMQNDFGARGGMFDRGGVDIRGIQRAMGPTCTVLEASRGAGVKVVYLKMGYRPDLSDMGAEGAPNRERHLFFGVGKEASAPNGNKYRTLIRDDWGTEILPELAPKPNDAVVWKHRFSGFYETELDVVLRRAGVRYLVVTGCTTSVCVDSTVRDAMFRDYSCLLLEDCMAEPIGEGAACHEASLVALQTLFAWVADSKEFLRGVEMAAAGGPSR